MEAWQIDWITQNKVKLYKWTEVKPKMISNLKTQGFLNEEEAATIERLRNEDMKWGGGPEVTYFYELLKKKNAYSTLISVLAKARLSGAAKILNDGIAANRAKSGEGEMERPPMIKLDNGMEVQEEIHGKIIQESDFLKHPYGYSVDIRYPPDNVDFEDDTYKKNVMGKRLVLLMNMIDFDDDPVLKLERRIGAWVDTNRLSYLFEEIGWEVENENVGKDSPERPNGGYITKADLTRAIENFKVRCSTEDVDSIIVYLSSHGFTDKFYTSDVKLLDIYDDIIYKFEHDAEGGCPSMKKKPKIFFQNTCAVRPTAAEACTGNNPDSTVPWGSEKTEKISDAILVKANIPGKRAHRHPKKGSFLAFTLVQVLMRLAWKHHFEELMKLVEHYIRCIKANTDDPHVQHSSTETCGLNKFYLFPRTG